VKRYGKYKGKAKSNSENGIKVIWNVKWYGKYERKVSWNMKWYGKYGRKVNQILKR
jgi:hypothetical protein